MKTFSYDPDTGFIHDKNGSVKGTISLGYLVTWFEGKLYRNHRIAWALHHGISNFGVIDHVNMDRADNRISNLRQCTQSGNIANSPARISNTSGIKGVSWCKQTGKWNATITKDRKRMNLGRFDSIEEAAGVYAEAAKHHFGEFARLS